MKKIQNCLVFLSNPYTHNSQEVVDQRYEDCLKLSYDLMFKHQVNLVSPVLIGHPIVKKYPMPSDWSSWKKYCECLIRKSEVFLIFKLDGYDTSVGVQEELDIAIKHHKKIFFINKELILEEYAND
jgi:hypothetical protein